MAGILHGQHLFFLQLGWLAHLSPGEHILLFLCALILQAAGGDPLTAVCTWLCQSWIVFVDASGEAGFQLLDQTGGRAVVDPCGAAALGPEGQQGQPFVEFWYGWKRRGMLMERGQGQPGSGGKVSQGHYEFSFVFLKTCPLF